MHKRVLGIITALLGATQICFAQDTYPNRPITIVVPFAPGGATDTTARLLATQLAKDTAYTFVVENKGGAGGSIGANHVAHAKPDGHTLLLGTSSTHGINTYAQPGLAYDAIQDFSPIGMIAENVLVLLAHATFPANSLQQAITHLKQQPKQYSYASPGVGTVHNLAMELFKQAQILDVVHVAYKGAGPAMIDLVAGTVPLMMGGLAPAQAFLASGQIKMLGIANNRRFVGLPNGVQYFSDLAPEAAVGSWIGLLAPAGTPPERIQMLSTALNTALHAPTLRQALLDQGMQVQIMDPTTFGELIANEMPFWQQSVARLKGN